MGETKLALKRFMAFIMKGSLRVSWSSRSTGDGIWKRAMTNSSSSIGWLNDRYVIRNVRTNAGSGGGAHNITILHY